MGKRHSMNMYCTQFLLPLLMLFYLILLKAWSNFLMNIIPIFELRNFGFKNNLLFETPGSWALRFNTHSSATLLLGGNVAGGKGAWVL